MNSQTRIITAWLLMSAIWLASWGAYVWFSRLDGAEDAAGEPILAFHTGFGNGWKELKEFGLGDYLSLAGIGIGIPLAVLILGHGVWWVAAEFKRNTSH